MFLAIAVEGLEGQMQLTRSIKFSKVRDHKLWLSKRGREGFLTEERERRGGGEEKEEGEKEEGRRGGREGKRGVRGRGGREKRESMFP